ncbi:ATP-binding SpoIIE family protein phosphatase [Methylobacter psychrophilus]|uniref:ATP-binding SpoIIE family protein phosphatase n=1 Tax=Methylobacter psychrophilus TaxID=96941 RepID=UPI0021D49452|nr:ATP-binding SpoIIE family protein phosphatase [Methylobacter psychrophilus]
MKIFPQHLNVQDPSDSGAARRLVISLCHELDFNEIRIGEAALLVTELATNLLKHTAGAGGDLIFCPLAENGNIGIDILSLDQGPGITNISESLRDGHSTAGSFGAGLGAIRRLSSVFDIFSVPGQGTVVLSRLWKDLPNKASLPSVSLLAVGTVCLPVFGEQACGDAWAMKAGCDRVLFMLADGLGHGPDAATAANLAVAIFEKYAPRSPEALLSLIHTGLHSTRGAAVSVVEVDINEQIVRYAGVGNLSGLIISGGASRQMVSNNGTAGLEARTIHVFTYPWPKDALLVLHSDGIATHWSLADYPGLAMKHPTLIAGVLFRDHQRLHDDSVIVVANAGGARRVLT